MFSNKMGPIPTMIDNDNFVKLFHVEWNQKIKPYKFTKFIYNVL